MVLLQYAIGAATAQLAVKELFLKTKCKKILSSTCVYFVNFRKAGTTVSAAVVDYLQTCAENSNSNSDVLAWTTFWESECILKFLQEKTEGL